MLKIPPDATFLYQIALFFVVWMLLKRFWITPALRVLKERSARSAGAVEQAEKVQAEVARMRQEHATALEQTRAEARREVEDILRTAEQEQKRLVDEATTAAQATLAEARGRIAQEVSTARAELDAQVGTIARQVATAALGRTV